jgi:hypothetical protein
MLCHAYPAVQAGTPMTAPGDVSLSPWLETGRRLCHIIWSKISIDLHQNPEPSVELIILRRQLGGIVL